MADKAKMLMLRKQGHTHKEIAEICGCSRQYAAHICGCFDPAYYTPVGNECIYPNLRNWMNKHKVCRKEFLRRMGLTGNSSDYDRFTKLMTGKYQPRKPYIDKMLAITGMTYEVLFYTEQEDTENV